jgi:hypothetical protein
LLGAVPPELLLLFKTNDCLRHLDRSLGTPINTAKVVAEVTANVVLKEDIWDCWNSGEHTRVLQSRPQKQCDDADSLSGLVTGNNSLSSTNSNDNAKSNSIAGSSPTSSLSQPCASSSPISSFSGINPVQSVQHLTRAGYGTTTALLKWSNVMLRVAGLNIVGLSLQLQTKPRRILKSENRTWVGWLGSWVG